MSKIVETEVGFFVCTRYDGRKIAGPMATKPEAYQAQSDTPALVVWQGKERAGFYVANEDTGAQVSGFFKRHEDAIREREKLCPTVKAPDAPPPTKRRAA
jgi:hypothetical protein